MNESITTLHKASGSSLVVSPRMRRSRRPIADNRSDGYRWVGTLSQGGMHDELAQKAMGKRGGVSAASSSLVLCYGREVLFQADG